jgi:hypothetical protein
MREGGWWYPWVGCKPCLVFIENLVLYFSPVCCEKLKSVTIWSSVSVDLDFVLPVKSFIPTTMF